MGPSIRALVSVTLVVASCGCPCAMAQEAGSRWWPFGSRESEPTTTEAVPTGPAGPQLAPAQQSPPEFHSTPQSIDSSTLGDDRPWLLRSPFSQWSWPGIHMPEVSFPKLWPERAEADDGRNAWMEQRAVPARPSPWQTVTNSAGRIGDSTRNAWRKTVDILTPGDSSAPRVAARDPKPSIWTRMFSEPDEPKGPRTISEWMSQERLNP